MKKHILIYAALLAAACSTETNDMVQPDVNPTRTLTVTAVDTRTTIGYEGSDVSHLVWCDGDEVAYCTDAASDVFKTAEVKSNAFKAEVPSNASSIVVIYPAGDNAGKSLVQASASLYPEIEQDLDSTFNGALLPMLAVSPIPANTNNVNVEYECLASVIRFTVLPSSDDESVMESLQSVTLTAAEDLTGTYAMGPSGSLEFTGSGKSVVMNVTGNPENLLLSKKPEVYAVVNRAAYTGVNVVVKTDLESYSFTDGAMDASHPERTLYRVNLDLSTVTPGASSVKEYFTVVKDIDDITDDGTYLIVTDKDASTYYMTDNKPTDSANYYYLMGVEISHDETGVSATEEIMGYTCNITKHDGGYKVFFPYLVKQGQSGVEMIAQGGSGSDLNAAHDGEGKAWYVTTETADGWTEAQQPRRYWEISVDSDGIALLRNKYDRGTGRKVYYKFCKSHSYFTLCHEGDSFQDVRILKLTTVE